jgi:hypothetical protein
VSLLSSQLKEDLKKYVVDFDIDNTFGVTLTLRQGIKNQKLDEISCSQNLRHFLNVLNQKVFGNQVKRFNKRLKVLPVLEMSKGNRLHYHLTLENPYPQDPNRFSDLIEVVWNKTKFGHRHIHIHKNVNWEWNDYITKFNNSNDQIDWMNYSN